MQLFFILPLLTAFKSCFCVKSNPVDFVEPIRAAAIVLRLPLRIQVMCCWNYDDRSRFYRAFQLHSLDDKDGVVYRQRDYQLGISDASADKFPKAIEANQQLIVIDLDCSDTNLLLQKVGFKLTQYYRWIILDKIEDNDNENGDEKMVKAVRTLPVLPDSEVIYIKKVGSTSNLNEKCFVYKQIYRLSLASDLIFEPFGIYENHTFYDKRSDSITNRRRRNLNGTQLRATLVLTNNDSIHHLTDGYNKQVDTISKVNYVLTQQLASFINADIQYTFVNSWGYKDTDSGQWSGMIGDLVDNRSDIGATALFFTPDRVHIIDYIAMPTPTRSKFVFRSPKLSYTENVFLLPFDTFVWISVVILIVITSFALLISNWLECKLKSKESEKTLHSDMLQPKLLDSFILVFGATCQQGSSVTPRSMTSRIIMFLVFLILMFLYTSYSANIVALLQSPSRKIQTLSDLLNSRLKLGADDTVFNRYYFTHANESIRQKIYQQKILNRDKSENFMSLSEGVQRMREGLFAFHMELGVGYKIVSETFLEDEKCGLQEIQYLQVIDPWYAVQKNSSYKEFLKIGLMRIHEHGIQERENLRLYTKKPKCNSGAGGKFITASLIDIRPAILILLWGFFSAFVAIIIEIIVHKKSIF